MTKAQENYLNMENAVIEDFNKNPAICQNNPLLDEKVGKVGAIRDETRQAALKQRGSDSKGQTEAKDHSRSELENNMFMISVRLRSYADATDDSALSTPLRYSRSSLSHLKTNDLLTQGRLVISLAKPHLSKLQDYQIDEPTLDTLQGSIDATAHLYANRDTKTDEGMEATERLARLITEARTELKKLDDLVDGFVEDSEFRATYHNSRRIHDIR